MPTDGHAVVSVLSLSGNILTELEYEVSATIHSLKELLMPIIAPEATASARLMLVFEGVEPSDDQSLLDLGVDALTQATFTGLIYDPALLAQKEMDEMFLYAVERSRREAEEARGAKQQPPSRTKESAESTQGPVLMLADMTKPLMIANQPSSSSDAVNTTGDSPPTTTDSTPLLMLTAEPSTVTSTKPESSEATSSRIQRDWRIEATRVAEAYDAFFEHISFRKGWKEPPFTREESSGAFKAASHVVARIRCEVLDQRDPGFKIRQVDGSARDWMHSPECPQLLREQPERFVAGLVHASFRDAHGYVEGLHEEEINDFIKFFS